MSVSFKSLLAGIAAVDRQSTTLRASVFTGTRLVAPRTLPATAAKASFMVSNQASSFWDWPIPLPDGKMVWSMSDVAGNDADPSHYRAVEHAASAEAPRAFLDEVVRTIRDIARYGLHGADEHHEHHLTLFVHGLGSDYDSAVRGTAALGANLISYADHRGLVMGFHWPSYGELASGVFYATSDAFPPTAFEGSIRDNINGSRAAFSNLLTFLRQVRGEIADLKLSLVCHSEGNYMAMLGLLDSREILFDHILLLAADVNNGAFQEPGPGEERAGRGRGIARSGRDVTVYYTGNDDVLPLSLYAFQKDYHNPSFGSRLGLAGPSYDLGKQADNLHAVDCAGVINYANYRHLVADGCIPAYEDGKHPSMHTSYLYIPQVVRDMGRVIDGTPEGEIPDRMPNSRPQSYTMVLDNKHNAPSQPPEPVQPVMI